MRHLLNTLYITTTGAWLSREGETIVVSVDREKKLQLPIKTIEGVVCIGSVGFSPPLLELCCKNGVTVSFLGESGHFQARVCGPVSGNILLRKDQYRYGDDQSTTLEIARTFILGKIANCRTVILRAARESQECEITTRLSRCAEGLSQIAGQVQREENIESLRGKEGQAGHAYFSVFDHMIVSNKEYFRFSERSRRPPMDAVNALLSFIYTLLAHECVAACESVGLDPQSGYLHTDRPGRPGLALDLMEELRPVLADRLVLSLINRQQVKKNDFKQTESGAVMMSDEAKKTIVKAWQERKRDELTHPYLEEKMMIGLLPYIQARLFARYIRGDLSGYPPFLWK